MRLTDITKYRSHWMGAAILWVVLLHSGFDISFAPLAYFRELGYAGVDIFVFASGIGLYCSYTRDHAPAAFLKRRVSRLYPTYFLFILLWLAFKSATGPLPFSAMAGNMLAIQGFANGGHAFNWYITFLAASCVLTPFLASFVETNSRVRNVLILLVLMELGTIPFWENDDLMLVIRLPLFVVGMCFGKLLRQDRVLTKRELAALAGSCIVGLACVFLAFFKFSRYLWSHGLYWYPFLLVTPGLCTAISLFFMWAERFRWGKAFGKLLASIGQYSFEVYLLHIFLFDLVCALHDAAVVEKSNAVILAVIVLLVPLTVLLHNLSDHLRTLIHRYCI